MGGIKAGLVSGVWVLLLLVVVFGVVLNVPLVKGNSGTIYIRADGSIDPPTPLVTTVDNVTYTFTGNISDSIAVERNNIVLDGAGYTLQGTGSSNGIFLDDISNVTIKNANIRNYDYGIYLYYSSNNSVVSNTVTANNERSIYLRSSSNNSILGNNVANSDRGICLLYSSDNNVVGNNVTADNEGGIWLESFCYNNNVVDNTITANSYGGIGLWNSANNRVVGNTMANNDGGIGLSSSNNNTVVNNTMTNNDEGITLLLSSSNNSINHNNFVNNTHQVVFYDFTGTANAWDDGYPSGGNYWSDYQARYPDASEIDSSGIWDTPYVVDEDNIDHYPLMNQVIIPEFQSSIIPLLLIAAVTLLIIRFRKK